MGKKWYAVILLFLLTALPAFAASINVACVNPCLIVKGEECEIEWLTTGAMDDHVNITIWHGGAKVAEIPNVPNVAGTNKKIWLVPAGLPTGKYLFRVATVDGLVQDQTEHFVNVKKLVLVDGPSGSLVKGSLISFSWHAFGLGISPDLYVDLYRNGVFVNRLEVNEMNCSFGCGTGTGWVVGNLTDPATDEPLPETAPAGGGYKIRISSMTGQYFDESATFTIVEKFDPGKFVRFRRISRIPVFPEPGCPMCGEVQLSDLLEIIQNEPGAHVVELWHAGRSLGKLFEVGAGRRRSAMRIDFGNSFPQLKQGGGGFELRVFDNRGKLLHTQAVMLNFKSR